LQTYFLYSAEQEAYQNMGDDMYLVSRPFLRIFFYTKRKNKKEIKLAQINGKQKLTMNGEIVFPDAESK